MNTIHHVSTTAIAAALLATLGAAQVGDPSPTPREEGQDYATTQMPMKIVKATAFTGAAVKGSGQEDIGEVKDLLVKPHTGEAKLAIVDFGGIEDVEAKTIALPVRLLTPTMDAEGKFEELRYTGTVEQIRAATEFDEERWSKLSNAEKDTWCEGVAEHFGGTERSGDMDEDGEHGGQEDDERAPGQGQQPMTDVGLMKASTLMDVDIHDSTGESLGDIEEMALDTTHGKLLFFVVDLGGFLGIGEDHYALPWRFASFRMDPEDEELNISVPVSKDILEDAPEFDDEKWQDMTRAAWLEQLYSHYRVEPYWGEPMEAGYKRDDEKKDDEKKEDDHRREGGGR